MLLEQLKEKFTHYKKRNLLRRHIAIQQRHENEVMIEGKSCINFCNNDYLALATHPEVKSTFAAAAHQYGFGSGSAAFISGYYQHQAQLEQNFAQFLRRDKAIFFNSGYLANLGVITSLVARNAGIIADKLCHASLIDAFQLAKAKLHRYRHMDLHHAQQLADKNAAQLLVTEGVFSMEGDIAPLKDLVTLAAQHALTLIVDDAHGIGILGQQGGGTCQHFGLTQEEVPCLVMSLGKAFASVGAIVAGKRELIESILQFSRSYIYTTALPPAITVVIDKILTIIQQEYWRRQRLRQRIEFFLTQCRQFNLSLISADLTPIKCILVENQDVSRIQQNLLARGFFVSYIRPPTVPVGTARIRVSLNCQHTEEQIAELLHYLSKEYDNSK